jgi:hypothetical protein
LPPEHNPKKGIIIENTRITDIITAKMIKETTKLAIIVNGQIIKV